MSIPVLNPEGLPAGQAPLGGRVAEQEIKPHLIHETVVAEMGARRAGTHSTLNRGEVRGGGRKPWRQKGTGRARQGSIRSPQWTGGGVVFGPTPRSHGGKVNRKVRAQAFRSALRAHAERGSVAVMDPTGWDSPSTKRAKDYLYQAPDGLADRALLVVVDDPEGPEGLSFRNLAGVYVLASIEIEVVDLMAARSLLVERSVWERWVGGELEVETVDVKRKPKKRRKAPPTPTPLSTSKAGDEGKPARGAAASDDAEEEPESVDDEVDVDDAPDADVADVDADAEVDTDADDADDKEETS